MEPVVPIVLLAALGGKVLDFIKYLTNRDWNAVVTQASAWATGIVLTFVASAANVFDGLVVPGLDQTFQDLNGASKVLVGSALLSLLSVAYDFKKAFDGTDSAKTPSLLPGSPLPPPQ